MLYSGKMIILNKEQEKFKKEFLNPIKFSLYFFKNVFSFFDNVVDFIPTIKALLFLIITQ